MRVPTREEEGCRDLCRLRGAAVFDRGRARQRLGSLLLRRHLVYRDGSTWTLKHRRWLRSLSFDDPGTQATFAHLLASVEERELRVTAIEADLAGFFARGPLRRRSRPPRRLSGHRSTQRARNGLVRCATGDGSPLPRSSWASSVSCPAEYSTGASTHRYGITKAGNAHVRRMLVEAAWAYRYPARVSPELQRRHQGLASRCRGPLLGRPSPALWTVPTPRSPQRPHHRRGHRGRPRTRRVRVGRNDRLTP